MFDEEGGRVEISELRSTPSQAESRGEIRYALFAEAGVTFLREKDERQRAEGEMEKEREGERERDKGNTGLASTQFPSLASNFRRIPLSHATSPLHQHVSLRLP